MMVVWFQAPSEVWSDSMLGKHALRCHQNLTMQLWTCEATLKGSMGSSAEHMPSRVSVLLCSLYCAGKALPLVGMFTLGRW